MFIKDCVSNIDKKKKLKKSLLNLIEIIGNLKNIV